MSEHNREDDATSGGSFSDPTAPADPPPPSPYGAPPATPSQVPPPPSAPYGTPPPVNPYPTSGQSPYGQPQAPYGDPNAPYGAPPQAYYQQLPSQSNTSALVLTIISGLGMFCCGLSVVSLVLGIIALVKQSTDPVQSAKLAKWGWIAFAVTAVLGVLLVVGYVVAMTMLEPGSFDSSY